MRKIQWGALLGAFLVLTACAGGDDTADQAAVDTTSVAAPEPASPAPVAANVQLPEGVTQEMVTQGQEVFNTNICWSCHQQNAVGGPLAPPLNDQEWLNADGTFESIADVIRNGVMQPKQYPSPMPPMGGAQLTEEQIRSLAAYVFSISRGG